MNIQVPPQAFKTGLLNEAYHERLIADLDRLAHTAGIPPSWVWSKLTDYCGAADIEWVKNVKTPGPGLCYNGKFDIPIENKMMAIAGACMRNYVDARMMSLQEVLTRLKNDLMPAPTVLLVPNFCIGKSNGGDIPSWQVSSLMGLLYTRLSGEQKTVIYVESMEVLKADYGIPFQHHIQSHYTIL